MTSGQTFAGHFLQLPSGADGGTVASAAVYGFLAFAGVEGAAALGEETDNSKTEIPRAIKVAVVVAGAFYLLTAAAAVAVLLLRLDRARVVARRRSGRRTGSGARRTRPQRPRALHTVTPRLGSIAYGAVIQSGR